MQEKSIESKDFESKEQVLKKIIKTSHKQEMQKARINRTKFEIINNSELKCN